LKLLTRGALAAGLIVLGLLAWGWWFSATHAYLNIQLEDYGLATDSQPFATPHDTTLEFFDEAGQRLAPAKTVEPYGYLMAQHPRLADCTALEGRGGEAYADCYTEYSGWSSEWAARTRFATVRLGRCVIAHVPVVLSRSRTGWATWWVPLPHVGGKPFESIGMQIRVNSRTCAPEPVVPGS
jgi:hypothetical protein